jgi:hypothetical protein
MSPLNPYIRRKEMKSSQQHSDGSLKRIRLFGVFFIVVGICFAMHGGLKFFEIYNQQTHMFAPEEGLTPEKGQMWSCSQNFKLRFLPIIQMMISNFF